MSTCSSFAWLLTGLDDILGRVERMEQGLPGAVPHALQTSDTSGDETDVSEPRRRVRTEKTFKMKKTFKIWSFFRDRANGCIRETQSFLLPIMQEGCVSVDRRHARDPAPLSGDEHFPRDQRLRLKTPGWHALDFEGNVMRDEEVARQRD